VNYLKKLFLYVRKAGFFLTVACLFTTLTINSNVSAATKDDALSSVISLLKAQQKCNVNDMIKYSQYLHNMSNLKDKEAYTGWCKQDPLQKANITSLSIINEQTALVSIQSTYKNKITLRTTPVIKKDGQWKVVIGIPPSEIKSMERNGNGSTSEVEKLFINYANALNAHDVSKMKNYIKTVHQERDIKFEEHLKALTQGPIPEITTYGINMISETFAVAQVEFKYSHYSITRNLAVCKENDQWKIIFGQPLTFSVIPITEKSVEVK
jgi:hypothetical protein